MFRGSVKGTGYPLHSPVSPSIPLPCVAVCFHISTGVYIQLASASYSVEICALPAELNLPDFFTICLSDQGHGGAMDSKHTGFLE